MKSRARHEHRAQINRHQLWIALLLLVLGLILLVHTSGCATTGSTRPAPAPAPQPVVDVTNLPAPITPTPEPVPIVPAPVLTNADGIELPEMPPGFTNWIATNAVMSPDKAVSPTNMDFVPVPVSGAAVFWLNYARTNVELDNSTTQQ